MILKSDIDAIKTRARFQSESRNAVIIMSMIAVIISLYAVILEVTLQKNTNNPHHISALYLPAATIVSSWFFTHLMFAFHYAHDYYQDLNLNKVPGILFPGNQAVDYWDFLYTSFIIGTSTQTADVSFANKSSRQIALVHSVSAFIYNTILLALTINIAASLM